MILWPEILPQNISGYSGAPGDGLIRTSMDAGPPKVRRRFTAVLEPVSGYIVVTPEQFTFFRTWYDNVLLNGALRFGWVHPFSGLSLTNLLTNGGFDSTTTGWSENPAGDTTAALVTGGIWGNCVQITRDTGDLQGIDQVISLTIGNMYSLALWVQSGTSGDESFICNINENGVDNRHQLAGSSLAAWAHHQMSFTVIDTCNQIHIYKASATAGTMLFDQVSVVDITSGVVDMRFSEVPRYSGHGARIRIDMKLEILP